MYYYLVLKDIENARTYDKKIANPNFPFQLEVFPNKNRLCHNFPLVKLIINKNKVIVE